MPMSIMPDLAKDPKDLFRTLASWYIFCELTMVRAGERRDRMFEMSLAEGNEAMQQWWSYLKEKYDKEQQDKQP